MELTHAEYIAEATKGLLSVAAANGLEAFHLQNVRYSHCSRNGDFDCTGDLHDDTGKPIFTVTFERWL